MSAKHDGGSKNDDLSNTDGRGDDAARCTEKKRTNTKVASNQWHTLRVDFQGNHFTVTFDGKKAIDWTDDTFKEAGKVGVWTKADSVTLFDDFVYGGQ